MMWESDLKVRRYVIRNTLSGQECCFYLGCLVLLARKEQDYSDATAWSVYFVISTVVAFHVMPALIHYMLGI